MNKIVLRIAILACTALALSSCAKEVTESSEDVQARVLEAWVNVNYGSMARKTASGTYILEMSEGEGVAVKDSSYLFVNYAIKGLDGIYRSTNKEDLSQQLGTYSRTKFYGDDIWQIGNQAIYPGVEEVLKQMKNGGRVSLVLPPAQTKIKNPLYTSVFTASGESDNIVFEISINDIKSDIYAYQKELLKEYSTKYYGGIDTLIDGLYFKKIITTAEKDSISEDVNIKLRYTGKLLNGHVFDTNIQDTAKKYRFYDSSNEYKALDQTFKKELKDYVDQNKVVEGFAKAVTQMNYGEKAVVFFWSKLGYKESGSAGSIPGYTPLFFEIYIEPKE